LGTSNAVNKGIRQTILSDKHKDFFFFHNGITAICNKIRKQFQKEILFEQKVAKKIVKPCSKINANKKSNVFSITQGI
jgi:hypothetical protein